MSVMRVAARLAAWGSFSAWVAPEIQEACKGLSLRERFIVERRLGGHSYRAIGAELEMSKDGILRLTSRLCLMLHDPHLREALRNPRPGTEGTEQR